MAFGRLYQMFSLVAKFLANSEKQQPISLHPPESETSIVHLAASVELPLDDRPPWVGNSLRA